MAFPVAQDLNFGLTPLTSGGVPLNVGNLEQSIAGLQYPGSNGSSFTDKAGLALTGLQTLGNLWGAFQMRNLAKKQFNFTKDITETNLANQIKSYNTALADRSRSRGAMEGQSAQQQQAYIDQNSLSRSH